MVALVTAIVVAVIMLFGILAYARRRAFGAPLSWGEAMIGAAYVFMLAFLAYGVIPHQWLTLAENEWGFRVDRLFEGAGLIKPISQGGWFPIEITYKALSDLIAVVFYAVFLGMQIWLWSFWQNRGQKVTEMEKAALAERSSFGRPLIKQG